MEFFLHYNMRITLRFAAIAATFLILLDAAHASAQTRVPRLDPGDCQFQRPDWAQALKIECSWLTVPETRSKPSGRTIRLAVAVLHTSTPAGPPLVMVHGGPGLSGLRIFLPAFRSELAHNRDLVIYDQRGSGYSEPKFCPKYTSARDSALLLRTLEEREKFWDRQDRECIAWLHGEGIDVSAYNTVASAADLIDLRKALGYEKWDVYSGCL